MPNDGWMSCAKEVRLQAAKANMERKNLFIRLVIVVAKLLKKGQAPNPSSGFVA